MDVFACQAPSLFLGAPGLPGTRRRAEFCARYCGKEIRLGFGLVGSREGFARLDKAAACLPFCGERSVFDRPSSRRKPRRGAVRDASDRYADVSNSKPDLRAPETRGKSGSISRRRAAAKQALRCARSPKYTRQAAAASSRNAKAERSSSELRTACCLRPKTPPQRWPNCGVCASQSRARRRHFQT